MNKIIMRNLLLVLGLVFLIGCSKDDDPTGAKQYGSIIGSVCDVSTGDGVPYANVKLQQNGKSTVTGSDGRFSFYELNPGQYTIQVTKDSYKSKETTVTVRADQQTDAHLVIERQGATLSVKPNALDFGEQETTLSFTIVNSHYGDLAFKVDKGDCAWISVDPVADIIAFEKTATVVIKIDRELLGSGENNTTLVVRSTSGAGNAEIKVTAIGEYRAESSVNTLEVSDITENSVKFNAEITNEGGPAYTERGFLWAKSNDPTMETKQQSEAVSINSNPKYSLVVKGLNTNTKYYVRAYVKQNGKWIYGNTVSFSTNKQETVVETSAATNVSSTSAVLNGSIVNEGNPAYTEKGFCYTTSGGTPTISDTKVVVSGTGTGNFSKTLSNLTYNKTYTYCAYAIQEGKAVYGRPSSFSTNMTATMVETSSATNITSTTAVLNGSIVKAGDPAYTEKGFCYNTSGETPTINDTKVVVSGTGIGDFSKTLSNLTYNKTYTYCAYAIQEGKPVYGSKANFKTSYSQASVTTSDITINGYGSLTLNGNVTSAGEPAITERGFCYSTSYDNPTISDTKVRVAGTNTGTYKYDLSNVEEDVTLYARAYVIQDGKAVYGYVKKVDTPYKPIVATGPNVQTKEGDISWEAVVQGAFYDGYPHVTEYGIVYATSSNPTVGSSAKVQGTSLRSEGDAKYYALTLKNLSAYKTYYFRAYVKTQYGYIYGDTESFSTF